MRFRYRRVLLTIGVLTAGFIWLNYRLVSISGDRVNIADVDPPLTNQRDFDSKRTNFSAPLLLQTTANASTSAPAAPKPNASSTSHNASYVLKYAQRPAEALCAKLLRPVGVLDSQTFQMVDGSRGMYVFSAYLDRAEEVVRVIAFVRASVRGKSFFCNLWLEDVSRDLTVVAAQVQQLPEGHGRRYTAAYVHCPLPKGISPYAVSITSSNCSNTSDIKQSTNILAVFAPSGISRNFTVCVAALNMKYSRAYELVEMIEMNRLLGADRFIFYVHSVGSNVEQILQWYAAGGIVELVNWKLPMEVDHWPPTTKVPEIHYFGQLGLNNDCLNRQRGTSKFAVYSDLDELIVPKKHTNWHDLLATVGQNGSAYIFRCIFFRKDWPLNQDNYPGRELADRFRSIVLSVDKREPRVQAYNQRAKYMVDPQEVQVVGIHNIWFYRMAGRGRSVYVPEKDALLHHYRSWEDPGEARKAVKDRDMYRFREELLRRLEERWRELPVVPLDIPIASYGDL